MREKGRERGELEENLGLASWRRGGDDPHKGADVSLEEKGVCIYRVEARVSRGF